MLQVHKYSVDIIEQGLVLEPNRKWDGSQNYNFVISGRLNSDYAKEPKDRCSVSGYVGYLEGAPAMFKSSTERTVSLSTTEAHILTKNLGGPTFQQYTRVFTGGTEDN
jgi:hypothetical protein